MFENEYIEKLLNDDKLEELYDYLTTKINEDNIIDEDLSKYYCQLGQLFLNYKFNKKNKKRASINLKRAIAFDSNNLDSYLFLCKAETDNNVIIKYLREAIKVIPNNPLLLSELYIRSREESLLSSLIESNIVDSSELFVVLKSLFNHGKYKCISEIITKHANKLKYYNYEIIFLYFFKPYIDLKNNEKWDKIISMFKYAIDKDLDNHLQYLPNIYLAISYYKSNKIDESIKTLLMIPINSSVSAVFDGPFLPFDLDLQNEILIFLNEIQNMVNKKEYKIHINALKTLIKVNPVYLEYSRFSLVDIKALEKYYILNTENYYSICTAIELYHQKNKTIKAIELSIMLLKQDFDLEKNDVFLDSLLDDIQEEELEEITTIVINEVKDFFESETWHYDNILSLVDPVISAVYRSNLKEKYSIIASIGKCLLDNHDYTKSSKIFEFAYSFSQSNYIDEAERLYRYLISINGETSAVLNNLAVIYNNQGKYIDALDLYKKAYDLDSSNEIAKRNWTKTQNENNERQLVAERLREVKLSIFCKLSDFIEKSPNKFEIDVFSYKESKIAKYFSYDQFVKMVSEKYFENLNYEKTNEYQVNLYLIEELKKYHHYKTLSRSQYLISNLSIEDVWKLGVTIDIFDKLDNITDVKLKNIIMNDLIECIVSVFAGNIKSSIVLIGSILEGVITFLLKNKSIEKIENNDGKKVKIEDSSLFELIEYCKLNGYISGRKYHFAHILKDYRNLIHPSRIIKEQYELTINDIELVWNSMLIFLKTIDLTW